MISCTFEDGNQANLRHVAVGCIVMRGNEILLARRSMRLSEGGKWCLPGGYMDMGESARDAARREVKEETGWDIDSLQLFGINDSPTRPDPRQTVDFIYIAEATAQTGETDWETEETAWFALDSLPGRSETAFDHLDSIELYSSYLREPFTLPIVYTHDRPSLI